MFAFAFHYYTYYKLKAICHVPVHYLTMSYCLDETKNEKKEGKANTRKDSSFLQYTVRGSCGHAHIGHTRFSDFEAEQWFSLTVDEDF